MKKIDPESNPDSLEAWNHQLIRFLLKELPRHPQSLLNDFKFEGMRIVTSSNRQLRIWNWDDQLGGHVFRYYWAVAEFKTPIGIKTKLLLPADTISDGWQLAIGRCDTIFSVGDSAGRMIYLPRFHYIADEGYLNESVDAYSIDRNKLNTNFRAFKSKSGKLHNSISLIYKNPFPHRRQIEVKGNELLVPKVIESSDYATSSSLRYEFDGSHFVYKGITK